MQLCQYCKTGLLKRYKESANQWSVRKYCNRQCSAYDKANNQHFIDKTRSRMVGNTINKGRKHETRKSPPSMKQETKDKISRFNKGRYAGEKNHFWKGGVTPEHRRIRSSVEYKKWRESVLARDNWHCVHCGVRQGWNKETKRQIILDADHIKPFSRHKELRLALSNGRTLCRDCHMKTPTYGRRTA